MTGIEIEYLLGLYFLISVFHLGKMNLTNVIKIIVAVLLIILAIYHYSLIG